MRRPFFLLLSSIAFALLLLPAACSVEPGDDGPPRAPVHTVTDTYWGVDVRDDYRYMENAADPEALSWAEAQNAYTRAWLDACPHREPLARRVAELLGSDSPDVVSIKRGGNRVFAAVHRPPAQQPFLVEMLSFDKPDDYRIVFDPNALDSSGGTTMDWYVPSHDGAMIAVSLSRHGTEDGTLYVYDTDSGERLADEIPRVQGGTAGGDAAWSADNGGLYYTRYPYPGERPDEDLAFYQQVWFHRLGDPIENDRYVIGEEFPRIAEIGLEADEKGSVIASVSYGDGGEYAYWLLRPGANWTRFADFADGVQAARFGGDGNIYLLSRKDAPNKKILRLSPRKPDIARAETIVPEPKDHAISWFVAGEKRLYLVEMVGGPSRLQPVDLSGRPLDPVRLGEISSVSRVTHLGGDRVLVRRETHTEPPAWYEYRPGLQEARRTALALTSPADFSGVEVTRVFAVADDGVEIPIFIMKKKETPLDGTAPLLLTSYGCYGFSQRPRFRENRLVWLEQGGIHAEAGIRGGGEYGDAWHQAARLERKKRSIDDMAACARHLAGAGYASPDRIAVEGGSAGGLLVYGVMVHHPETIGAVVSHVGFGDMIRSEFSPNGRFNVTEFGTVEDSVQFAGMYGYSPYHHIRDGVDYPPLLSLTGMNDPRVEPWHVFKMNARFLAADPRGPVLLRIEQKGGHTGSSLAQREASVVDVYSFLFRVFGVEYRPAGREAGSEGA
ncbi:MAG: S9 family peptidase [Candidatus Eisenbacteria bacterium]|nr:S9 family peptidase [Candidatus Eisenbacteria bacterium]